jgi:hypothetical protein
LVAMSRRNQQKKNSVGRNKNSVGRSKNCIGRDKDFKFRICILSHSGLDRTLYIASLHSGRMAIRELWNIQPIVGIYTYPI